MRAGCAWQSRSFPLVAVVLLGEKVKPLIYCDMRVRDLDIGRASFKYLIELYLRNTSWLNRIIAIERFSLRY